MLSVDVQRPNSYPNTGRVLTVRRTSTLNGVEVYCLTGRPLRVNIHLPRMSIVCVFQGVQWITALKCLFGNLEIPWVELLDIGDRRPNHVFSYLSHLAVLCNMPNSCPLFKICKAYADLWLLYFVYLQCSLYCFVRSVPVCPTFARFRCNVSICR